MKSTLKVFKNQSRPNLCNNNSTLKSTDSSSNISNKTELTNASKLSNTSLNPIDGTKITSKQNKNIKNLQIKFVIISIHLTNKY